METKDDESARRLPDSTLGTRSKYEQVRTNFKEYAIDDVR